jgi:mitogen-activated protein kinase kinase 7
VIKLCDFGISGNLVNSNAFSRSNTGSAGYIAPERIDPADPTNPVYDIRADIWSLGITLVELATGKYPYENCNNDFEVMSSILSLEAPKLEGDAFSADFRSFVNMCLRKDVKERPKYNALLKHPFILHFKQAEVDVKSWFGSIVSDDSTCKSTNDSANSSK